MNPICLHGHVAGRVQRVSYRAFTRQQARAHGVTGYARNLPDGRVELLLCGNETDVLALLEVLRRGPPQAQVSDITMCPAAWRHCEGFVIE